MHDILELIHWSFFAVALVISVTTEFLRRVFKLLPQNKWVKLFTPSKLFPAILGMVLGMAPGIPGPELIGGDEPGFGHMLYFASAGIVSAWFYSLARKIFEDILPIELKEFVEKRLGTEGDSPDGVDDDTRG